MKEELCVILTILDIISRGQCFRSDLMHHICGSTINGSSGKVVFDAKKLPVNMRSCSIILTMGSNQNHLNETNHLMFYFTKFQMNGDCDSASLRIFDGDHESKSSEKGKAQILYGCNEMAVGTGITFSSPGNKINVSFTGTDTRREDSGYFTFMYSSFHTGVCEMSKEVDCLQGNIGRICIRKDIADACTINVCGSLNNSTCSSKPLQEKSMEFVKYIMCALLGIFVLFGIKFFYGQYRKGRNGHDTCISRIKQRFLGKQQDCQDDRLSTLENYSALNVSSHAIENGETRPTDAASSETHLDTVTQQDDVTISPSAPALEELDSPRPVSLPPTYDESVVPSYNEVMAHQDKYIVH